MTTEQLVGMLQSLGLPTVLLLGLLVGLYKLGRLVLAKVVVPVAEAHVNFLNVSCANMEKITENLDTLNNARATICRYDGKCQYQDQH